MKIGKRIVSIMLGLSMMVGSNLVSASVVDYGNELTNAPSKSYTQTFSDVPTSYWAFSYIGEMVERGVLNGYPDGRFYPDNNVSRAEFAKIITVAAGLSVDYSYYTDYVDVLGDPDNAWAAPYIETAKYYLSGYNIYGETYYLPAYSALREDIAVAMVKLKGYSTLGYDLNMLKTMFSNWESISSSAQPYVAIAVERGLISGYEDGTFGGQQGITRAEAATLLWRAYQYGNDNKVFVTETIETPTPKPTETKKPIAIEDVKKENTSLTDNDDKKTNTNTKKDNTNDEEDKNNSQKLAYKLSSLSKASVSDRYLYATQDDNDNLYYYDSSKKVIYKLNMDTGTKSTLLSTSSLSYEIYKDEEQEVTKTITKKIAKEVSEDDIVSDYDVDDDIDDDETLDEDIEASDVIDENTDEDNTAPNSDNDIEYEEITEEVTEIETVSVLQGTYKEFELSQIYYNTSTDELVLIGEFTKYKSEKSHNDKSQYLKIAYTVDDKKYIECDFASAINSGRYIIGNMDNGNVCVCDYDRYNYAAIWNMSENDKINTLSFSDKKGFFYTKGSKAYYCNNGRVYEYSLSSNKLSQLWDDSVGYSAHGMNNKTYYTWDTPSGVITKIGYDGEPNELKINTKTDV